MANKALFLDRDGVINEDTHYLHRVADVKFIDGIFPLCRAARECGYLPVVVTNQSGIGRGIYTHAQFDELMGWMAEEFRREGAALAGIYQCPYHPEHGIGEYKREHEDRKPGAGMLRRAARDLDLDLAQSVMVGDRCSDIKAAHAAGLQQSFLLAGRETEICGGRYTSIRTLAEAERWLRDALI